MLTLSRLPRETALTGFSVCHQKSLIPVSQVYICNTCDFPWAMIYAIPCPVLLLRLWFISVLFSSSSKGSCISVHESCANIHILLYIHIYVYTHKHGPNSSLIEEIKLYTQTFSMRAISFPWTFFNTCWNILKIISRISALRPRVTWILYVCFQVCQEQVCSAGPLNIVVVQVKANFSS